jgi:hypothetical protein
MGIVVETLCHMRPPWPTTWSHESYSTGMVGEEEDDDDDDDP